MFKSFPIALGLLFLSSCGHETVAKERLNVVLICLDTVRADHLGFYGYAARPTTPALDALAARSLVFDDASALAGWTKPSVPSFLTGTPPAVHGVYEGSARAQQGYVSDVLGDQATTLAEVFQAAGYQTGALIRNAQLRAGMGFEQGFDSYEDEAGNAAEIRHAAVDWLDQQAAGEPFFLYLHFLDAHWPYPVPDSYATRWARPQDVARYRGGDLRALRDAINDGTLPFGEAERDALVGLYDGSIRYLDDQLGLLFAELERRGLAENTVIALIADHGEEFGEHGRIGHGHGLSEGLTRVPFLLHVPHDPALAGARVATPVSLLDLFPTLVSAAGLVVPPTHQGVNRLIEPHRAEPVFAEHKAPDKYMQTVRAEGIKVQREARPNQTQLEPPLSAGERYEAEFALDATGWLATQIKPRDEDPDAFPELKGPVRGLAIAADGTARFWIGELAVEVPLDAQLTATETAADATLEEGRMVKVRGPIEVGGLIAERVKVYARDETPALELRGTAGTFSEDLAQIRIGGVWVRMDVHTTFKELGDPQDKRRMSAKDVRRFHTGGLESMDVDVKAWRVDGMTEASTPEIQVAKWISLLDQRFAAWAGIAPDSAGSGRLLNQQELNDLEAIGYAGD